MTPNELRARRAALGLTQQQLAAALGVARNTVGRWELGAMAIRHPQLVAAALDRLERERLHGDLSRSFATSADLRCWAEAYGRARRRGCRPHDAVLVADLALTAATEVSPQS